MQITALYRHPLKSHGRETLDSVILHAGQSMPYDRRWAVAHDASKADGSAWAPCANFSRGSKAPALAAINASFDEASGLLTLTHPALPTLTFDPDREGDTLVEWVRPIVPDNRALPDRILALPERGFTDTEYASVSLCNTASHAAVEDEVGKPISPLRWRGNIWFEGAAAWEEFDWVKQDLSIGEVILRINAPILRCLATTSNPETGQRDVDTLGVLNRVWDHQDFGIYGEVMRGGRIAVGDTLTVR
jgi:uncharacterized protein YcbX